MSKQKFSEVGDFFSWERKRFFKQAETTSPVLGRTYNAICLGPADEDVNERYYFEAEDEVEVQ